ncbi:MAG: CDP-alcohol phosphatidyltransferase family protein [Chitinophagales bacterium]
MKLIRNLPNILTLFNLFLGCMAIVYIFQDHMIVIDQKKNMFIDLGKINLACYCVFLAAFIDFFDGFIARLLKAQSKLGEQLDSLADMVTFGLVPGVILFELLARSYYASVEAFDYPILYYSIGFAVTLFAALRLAKFNIDERQVTEFRGLPTPSMALIVCSLPLIILKDELGLAALLTNKWFLLVLIILLCYLMVSDLRLLSLKMKNFRFAENNWQYMILLLATAVLLWGLFIAQILFVLIPLVIMIYIILSIAKNIKEHGI